jgi:hypothetical protein
MKATDMFFRLVNQAVRVWERVRGDIPTKIVVAFLGAGVALLAGGGWAVNATILTARGEVPAYEIGLNLGGAGVVASVLGALAFSIGICLGIARFCILIKKEQTESAALVFFHGFPKINDELPVYALPRKDQNGVIKVGPQKLNSYDPKSVEGSYEFLARMVQDRVYHQEATKAYIAAIGAIPYLYMVGTLFRDGHLPLVLLEHERNNNRWHRLDALGQGRALTYELNGLTDKEEILQACATEGKQPRSLAVSFTSKIRRSELPQELQDRTVSIELDGDKAYDALPCEQVQEEVSKDLAHFITQLAKDATELHLFICAQASFVVRLGTVYQDGMTGAVVVHNYDPISKSYPWALALDGKQLTTRAQQS